MADFIFKISPNIMVGSYLTARLGQYAKEYGNHFMVIIDSDLKKLDIESKVRTSLEECSIDFFIVNDVKVSPDTAEIERVLKLAKDARIQGIISIGSSKISNFSKAISALYNEEKGIYDYIDGGAKSEVECLPLICIPTHMKDEFLFSNRIPLVDARSRKTVLAKAKDAMCKLALFDPNLTIGMTDKQVSSNFLCALCIAIEAYISQKANFFSDTIIEKAIELLASGIKSKEELTEAENPESYLAEGSCMTSMGVAVSALGPASILALLLDGRYQIDSALSSVILLPYIIEDTAKYKIDRIVRIARIMKICEADTDDEGAKNALLEFIRSKLAENELPARLADLNVTIEQLAAIADNAGSMDIIDGFPKSMNSDDLFELLKQAF
ncbi:MAG: iron-containing alcohol dehydrogenase [Treponemataceae bacterium]|nr:iron-containing alcohol dehydrogenase [Treponemataceae bacterium]